MFDRLGPRRLFQWGALLAAGGFVLSSQAGSLLTLVLAYGLIAGLGITTRTSRAAVTRQPYASTSA